MAYDITLVQGTGPVGGLGIANTAMGFPTAPFNFLLASVWMCLPADQFGRANWRVFFSPIIDQWGAGATDPYNLRLLQASSLDAFYSANFTNPTVANVRTNMLLSVDCVRQVVQYYVNDVPVLATSGGWVQNQNFWLGPFPTNIWSIDLGNIGDQSAAIADFYMGAPDAFFDLSITANRRKFINADLTPVSLGLDGSVPTGKKPAIFLTVNNGTPDDFLTNYGSGVSWGLEGVTLSFQTPGTCTLPPPPPPPPPPPVWAITSSLDTEFPGAVGDVWANDSYIDFSDPNVRATFENADGSWLWLGSYGERATGISPLLFLTVQEGAQPSDILIGYGQNQTQSHWSLTVEGIDPATGQSYPAMSFDVCGPTVINNLELTDIQVTTTTILPVTFDDLITLRWSDDAGASWSNGLLKSLGKAGEYFTTPTWYRLGMARNRIIELSWSGARAEALQGCFVEVTIAAT